MGILKSFLKENKKTVLSVFLVWIMLCIAGVVFGSKFGGKDFEDAKLLVESAFSKAPVFGEIIGTGALSNLKFLGVIIISSLSVFLSPLVFFLAGFKGFSSGFCAAVIMRVFSSKGIFINFASIILPLCFSIPIYLTIFVSALKFSMSPQKDILTERVSQRRKQWLSYFLLQLCLTFCLFLVTIMEALLNWGIIFMINK